MNDSNIIDIFANKLKSKIINFLGIETLAQDIKHIKILHDIEKLERILSKIAPSDELIFVCINGVGDTMMYASYWRELEAKYKRPIFWVVIKAHEIILKMYGITNYLALEGISAHKSGKPSQYLNPTGQPIPGIPYYAHWTYFKPTDIWRPYFLDFVRKSLNIGNIPLHHPVHYPQLSENIKKKFPQIKDFRKVILINPEARYLTIKSTKFWNSLADKLRSEGFALIINNFESNLISCSKEECPKLSLEELVAISFNCHAVISPRSGFTDIIHELGSRLFIIYDTEKMQKLFTLNPICSTKNIHEYIYNKNFNFDILLKDIATLKN